MEPGRARRKAKFAAVVLVVCGIVAILQALGFGFVITRLSQQISKLAIDEHVLALLSALVPGLKALIFAVIPGLGIIRVAAGFSFPAHLKRGN